MKRILQLATLLAALSPALAFPQGNPNPSFPPATQAEVNAGLTRIKFVSPLTLTGWDGLSALGASLSNYVALLVTNSLTATNVYHLVTSDSITVGTNVANLLFTNRLSTSVSNWISLTATQAATSVVNSSIVTNGVIWHRGLLANQTNQMWYINVMDYMSNRVIGVDISGDTAIYQHVLQLTTNNVTLPEGDRNAIPTVYFPPGIYYINSPLTIRGFHCRILGAGATASVIRSVATGADAINVGSSSVFGAKSSWARIQDICIRRSIVFGETNCGIRFQNAALDSGADRSMVQRVIVQGFWTGIKYDGAMGLHMEQVEALYNQFAWDLSGAQNVTMLNCVGGGASYPQGNPTETNLFSASVAGAAILAEYNGARNTFGINVIGGEYGWSEYGIKANGGFIAVNNPNFEGCTTNAIWLGHQARATIDGSRFGNTHSNNTAIYLEGDAIKYTTIRGVLFNNNETYPIKAHGSNVVNYLGHTHRVTNSFEGIWYYVPFLTNQVVLSAGSGFTVSTNQVGPYTIYTGSASGGGGGSSIWTDDADGFHSTGARPMHYNTNGGFLTVGDGYQVIAGTNQQAFMGLVTTNGIAANVDTYSLYRDPAGLFLEGSGSGFSTWEISIERSTGDVQLPSELSVAGDIQIFAGGTFDGNGSGISDLNASAIASGTVPTARLGGGTANSSTFLRGDQTWAVPPGSGSFSGISTNLQNYTNLTFVTHGPGGQSNLWTFTPGPLSLSISLTNKIGASESTYFNLLSITATGIVATVPYYGDGSGLTSLNGDAIVYRTNTVWISANEVISGNATPNNWASQTYEIPHGWVGTGSAITGWRQDTGGARGLYHSFGGNESLGRTNCVVTQYWLKTNTVSTTAYQGYTVIPKGLDLLTFKNESAAATTTYATADTTTNIFSVSHIISVSPSLTNAIWSFRHGVSANTNFTWWLGCKLEFY
jgi:hypothetical protein